MLARLLSEGAGPKIAKFEANGRSRSIHWKLKWKNCLNRLSMMLFQCAHR